MLYSKQEKNDILYNFEVIMNILFKTYIANVMNMALKMYFLIIEQGSGLYKIFLLLAPFSLMYSKCCKRLCL